FIPDRNVRNALYRAVLRGVRVRVLVPSKSDVAVVQFALEAMYESLLRNGVEIYCHSGPMMHAKTAIIDDRYATIGSYNLDERSRTKNLEVTISVDDEAFATYVRRWFDRDLETATHLDLYEWRARPLARRGIDAFRAWPDLYSYLSWRTEPVTSLVAEIRAAADPATRIVLIDLKDGWLGGVDLAAVGMICDGAILCCYSMEPDAVSDLMQAGRTALGPEKYLGAGFRVFYPEVTSAEALAARARAAIDGGADGINFYNYGLIPQRRLDWVRQAIHGLRT
ncbi:MAG: hypothetical protein EON58_13795, partial [Alphaproteobacteria bacterium]